MSPPSSAPATPVPHAGLGFHAFVAMIALMMALNALAIDAMLPALPAIGAALNVPVENDRQWVLTAYLIGFGAAQLVYGNLSDRYGRRPILLIGLSLYVLLSLVAAMAWSFPLLIAARALQGLGAAALRVVAVSVVRDCYGGRQMARVMSLALMVFLLVPILAPTFGTLVLLVAPWRWIFGLLAAAGGVALIWVWAKLPETLHPEDRRAIDVASVAAAWRTAATDRSSLGYTIASTLITGALFGFINSVQQITADVFRQPSALPFIFAAIGSSMALGSLINSRIVERLGTRRVSHSGLVAFILVSALHLAVVLAGVEDILAFGALQALTMFCFAFCGANFGAMAMERMGHVAGAAASFQGSVSTVGGALAGFAIGQHFDGTTVPIVLGFVCLGIGSLLVVLVTEKGRLFRPHEAAPASAA